MGTTVISGAWCPVGSYSATGGTPCTLAPIGSYVDTIGASFPTPAPVGDYVDTAGATHPTPCPAGLTTFTTGSTAASACVPLHSLSQTISFSPPATGSVGGSYGLAFGLAATASSGLPVQFSLDPSSTPGACSIVFLFHGDVVMFTGPGRCVIDANQPGNWIYGPAATVAGTTVIGAQTISFGPLGGALLGSPPFAVSASASSGLAVSFTSASPAVCTVSGATVTVVAAGLCTVEASQPGNTVFASAALVQQSFIVSAYTGGPLGDCHGPALTAPTHPSSAPGDRSAVLSWFPTQNPPPSGCVAGYVVTPSLNGVAQPPDLLPGGGSTTVLKGLTNGGVYTFTVASEDGTVIGPQSTPTAKITVGTPTAATALKLTHVAKRAIRVAFKAARGNGASITKYTATCQSSDGGATKSTSGKSGPLTVTGVTPGKTYTCRVTATNSRGTGAAARSGSIKG